MPETAKKTLAKIRARIAHGSADLETLELAYANLPALQRLVADGIALVYGVDPTGFNVLEPSPIRFLAPILRAQYSPEENPVKRWGDLLSDSFRHYLEAAKTHESTSTSTPSNPRLHPTAAEKA